jgi:BirA family biotin operon repressor/biotin-[acetyl-CoA-carboxylase] ligase
VRLPPEAEAAGYRLLSLEATESTNDDAVRAARDGDPGLLWVVAREQIAGRGRHGRHWESPPGNLYATLLLDDPCDAATAPQLGFVAGLALHEAVEHCIGAGVPRLSLKWPNDLLLDGAKVAGLLLEGHRISATGRFAVVIGFGVNVGSAPSGTPYPAAALRGARPDLEPDRVFSALSLTFARAYAAWRDAARMTGGGSFSAIRTLWLERAAGLGREVVLRLPSGERRGIFAGMDASGRLQLQGATGTELIDAGDLYLPERPQDIA